MLQMNGGKESLNEKKWPDWQPRILQKKRQMQLQQHKDIQRTKRQNAATPYEDFVVVCWVAAAAAAAAILVCFVYFMRCNK